MSHSRSRSKHSQNPQRQQLERSGQNPRPNYERSGNRYPEQSNYEEPRDHGRYMSDEEKGRQFGSSWRSGNTQRESGNRDWVSGVSQPDYRNSQEREWNPAGYQYNEYEFDRSHQGTSRGPRRSMEEGNWGNEGGGGWSSTTSQTKRPSFAGRGPQGYRRSDERITEDINEELTQDDEVDASGISVEVKNGEVVLKGTVSDRESK